MTFTIQALASGKTWWPAAQETLVNVPVELTLTNATSSEGYATDLLEIVSFRKLDMKGQEK